MDKMNVDVIDILGDLLTDIEKSAASSPRKKDGTFHPPVYGKPLEMKRQNQIDSSRFDNNINIVIDGETQAPSNNLLIVTPGNVEPSFLYAPDKDIITGQPLIRTASPGPVSPRLAPPRSSSGMSMEAESPITFGVNDSNEDFKFQSYHLDYKFTPPPIKGPCCVCGDGIMGAMVTALDKMWHPEHFCCVHCGVELRSPMYVEHDAKPYCKMCHGKLFLPPCAHCKKEITGAYVTAMNKIWHPDCFKCSRCRKVLTPTNFFQKEGKPYCEDDFHDLFSPKCHACKLPIKDDRKISVLGKHWHPEHFKCCKCGCLLTPNNFKEKNGNLYCEKDFNDLFMPKCAGCSTPVVTNPTNAMGKTWHPACFKCTQCKKQLPPDKFFEKDGKPYCEDDFHKLFSPKCAGCLKPIKDPKKMVTAQGKNWHPEHFNCTECGKVLSPNNFFEKNGLPYCEDDFHKLFSPKCAGCGEPIKDQKKMVVAQGKNWHPDHFNCTECGKVLSPNNFFEKDGLPYCEDDFHKLFSPRCAGCNQPIKDQKYIYAMDQYWHPDHFTCDKCGKVLKENEYFEKDGKVYCLDDFLNLFAPKCCACRQPIKEEYCLVALEGDWHANCFRCKDCNCPLEDKNFFEIDGQPYCEQHFHARQCPDCIRMRRAQNKYFGIPSTTPMQPSRWASQVSLKSMDLGGGPSTRPVSQVSQVSLFSTTSYDTAYSGGRSSPNPSVRSFIIPIEKEGQTSQAPRSNNNGHIHSANCQHNHDHNGHNNHSNDHHNENEDGVPLTREKYQGQRSSLRRDLSETKNLSLSQHSLQYIARNENPYNYIEPGKFPVEPKHIRFSDTVTRKEFESDAKYY